MSILLALGSRLNALGYERNAADAMWLQHAVGSKEYVEAQKRMDNLLVEDLALQNAVLAAQPMNRTDVAVQNAVALERMLTITGSDLLDQLKSGTLHADLIKIVQVIANTALFTAHEAQVKLDEIGPAEVLPLACRRTGRAS